MYYVLATCAHRERLARRELAAAGHATLLPTYTVQERDRLTGKRRRVERALLPGYLFATRLPPLALYTSRDGRRMILGPLRMDGAPQTIPAEVMAQFMAFRAEVPRLSRGDHARIIAGPFEALEVIIERVTGDSVEALTATLKKLRLSMHLLEAA